MPESSSSTASSSSSTAGAPQTRSTFNRTQLEDLELAEDIVRAARGEPYKSELIAREIPPAEVESLWTLCGTARQRTTAAILEDTAGEAGTLLATGQERALILLLQEIQAAAKQKYGRRQPVRLQDFFVGRRLNPNDAVLHQSAFTIALILTPPSGTDLATARDRLPGIALAKINTLRGMIGLAPAPLVAAGGSSASASSSSSSSGGGLVPPDAVADRAERDRIIREINDRRMEIQWAMDAGHPYTEPANAEARRAFHLPRSRPFNG